MTRVDPKDVLCNVDPDQVLRRLGAEPAPRTRRKWSCPACGSSDALHSYGVGRGVYCFACKRDLIAMIREARGLSFVGALKFAAETTVGPIVHRREPEPVRAGFPPRPFETWTRARRIDARNEAGRWCLKRGFSIEACADLDLFRFLPAHEQPAWCWRTHPVLFPVFDADAEMRSFRFRSVGRQRVKTRVPYGGERDGRRVVYRTAGLVLMSPGYVRWLRGDDQTKPSIVIVAEGEPSFVALCLIHAHVIGIASGGWNDEHALALPQPCKLLIATDGDEAGEGYAKRIASRLPSTVRAFRVVPEDVRRNLGGK